MVLFFRNRIILSSQELWLFQFARLLLCFATNFHQSIYFKHMLQAAERNPRDVTLWLPLIDFAEDEGDLKQAIVYARNGK